MDESTAGVGHHGTPALDGMGRRGFLFAAGIATVGVWVAPSIISLSPALAVTSPGPDDKDEQDRGGEGGGDGNDGGDGGNGGGDGNDGSDGGNGKPRDGARDDVLDDRLAHGPLRGAPTHGTRTGGTPTHGAPGRDDLEVRGVTLVSSEHSLPRTGVGRDALLGVGSAAVMAGASLLRINRSQVAPAGDTDPPGVSDLD